MNFTPKPSDSSGIGRAPRGFSLRTIPGTPPGGVVTTRLRTVCLLVVLMAILAACSSRPPMRQMALPDVEVAQVETRDVPVVKEWVGTLDGRVNADIRGQVTGYLLRQVYREGTFVRKGELLFEIDPRPFWPPSSCPPSSCPA